MLPRRFVEERVDNNLSSLRMEMPTFNGDDEPEVFLNWVDEVEDIFGLHNFGEEKKFKTAIASLKDFAKLWWKQLSRRRLEDQDEPIETWGELKREMRRKFVPSNFYRDMRRKLQELKQGSKSVREFYKEMERLKARANIQEDDETTIAHILEGLNRDIRRELRNQEFDDVDKLVRVASKVEDELRSERGSKPSVSSQWDQPRRATNNSYQSRTQKEYSRPSHTQEEKKNNQREKEKFQEDSKQKVSTVTCYRCQGRGHYARECPNTKKILTTGKDEREYMSANEFDDEEMEPIGERQKDDHSEEEIPQSLEVQNAKNKRYVEGSIVDAYMLKESTHFASFYLDDDVHSRLMGRRTTRYLSAEERFASHQYVLLNCEEVQPSLRLYENSLRLYNPGYTDQDVDDEIERNFAAWFKGYVYTPMNDVCNQSLIDLASGSIMEVNTYLEVIEVEYPNVPIKKVVLFKCEWFDPTPNVVSRYNSEYGIAEVHCNKRYRKWGDQSVQDDMQDLLHEPLQMNEVELTQSRNQRSEECVESEDLEEEGSEEIEEEDNDEDSDGEDSTSVFLNSDLNYEFAMLVLGGVKKGGYMLGFGSDTQHYFPEVARRKKSRNGESSSHVACDEKFEQLDQTNKDILENQKNIMGLLHGIYSAHPELVEYVALTADSNQSGDVGLDNVDPTTDSNQSGDVGLDNLSMDDDTQSPA
nr:putative retrotransposon polyprotein [Ipomoea batatas]